MLSYSSKTQQNAYYTHHRQVQGLGHIGDGKGRGIMLHSCLAVVPIPLNPQILGLAGQIPWLRSGVFVVGNQRGIRTVDFI